MNKLASICFMLLALSLNINNSFAQKILTQKNEFYPHRKNKLKTSLSQNFDLAGYAPSKNVVGLIAPKGNINKNGFELALAYSNLDRDKEFGTIFILGSVHKSPFKNGIAMVNSETIKTPLGEVMVDTAIVKDLENDKNFFTYDDFFQLDQSLAGHILCLQYQLNKPFKVVPLILGSDSKQRAGKAMLGLKNYFGKNNLFISITEFTNDLPVFESASTDELLTQKVIDNKPWELLKTRMDLHYKLGKEPIDGIAPLLAIQYITYDRYLIDYEQIKLPSKKKRNKQKIEQPMTFRILEQEKELAINLTEEELATLFNITKTQIKNNASRKPKIAMDKSLITGNLKTKAGAFIMIKKNGKLRSVYGEFENNLPLAQTIYNITDQFSIPSPKFKLIKENELKDLTYEITIVTPLQKLKDKKDFIPGKHGVYMKKDGKSGYYMPFIYDNTKWSTDKILGNCAKNRLKMGSSNWQLAETYIFELQVYNENGLIP